MQFLNKKKIIIIIIISILIFIFLIILNISSNNKSKQNDPNTYFDPLSGETISDTPGKTEENYGNENIGDNITYLGFGKLLNSGTTLSQVDNIKKSIAEFSFKNNLNITEVSVDVKKINPIVNDEYNGVNFPIKINRKTFYDLEVKYLDVDNIIVNISENNKKIFEYYSTPIPDDPETITY